MQKKKISVAILYYTGTHKDDEDTVNGVRGIVESLKRTGHPVKKIIVTKKNWFQVLTTPGDVVFNYVEDDMWELYEKISNGLEHTGRGQVGQDIKGLPYATRKAPGKLLMRKKRINTPNFRLFTNKSKRIRPGSLRFPVIIKPSKQHAGIGISQRSVVNTKRDFVKQITHTIHAFSGDVIAEEYINGREIHVTVLGNGTRLTVLPFCEIRFRGKFKKHWTVYTYQAKWDKDTWEYADAWAGAPAVTDKILTDRIKRLARRAYRTLHCSDIARMDMRIDKKGIPYIVDVNMNPSINVYDDQDATLASVYARGWTYDEFIEKLLSMTHARISAR